MCGIFGVIGSSDASLDLLAGLKKLEYRGYDSSGIAVEDCNQVNSLFATGKLNALETLLAEKPIKGQLGIGHTRWATHGEPNVANAHPHICGPVAVVHNGIIENYRSLKQTLVNSGHVFQSDTDSEVVPHLIHHYMNLGYNSEKAIRETLKRLEGTYALGIIIAGDSNYLYAARKGSPLVIGMRDRQYYVASDALALSGIAEQVIYLENEDFAKVSLAGVSISNAQGEEKSREWHEVLDQGDICSKEEFDHYMLKEIYEQPTVILQTLAQDVSASLSKLPLQSIEKLYIVACGTSYYAGCIAKYWIEKIAKVSVEVEIASEFRYRDMPINKRSLALFISQSGETADTLAALREIKKENIPVLSIVNVDSSSMVRESDAVLLTKAGPEIGVASTKAFTCQLALLANIALYISELRSEMGGSEIAGLKLWLQQMPSEIEKLLSDLEDIKKVAYQLQNKADIYYLGRGMNYPLAMEGALKLKEISYIHAEGIASGELKHGPIAMLDEETAVVMLIPNDHLVEKSISNFQEVTARGAKVIAICGEKVASELSDQALATLTFNCDGNIFSPFISAVYLQLIAYYVALYKGTDIDQPRNLAKSVTVE